MTKRIIIALMCLCFGLAGVFAHTNPQEYVTAFTYNYIGTIGGNSYAYDLRVKGETAVFTLTEMEHADYGEMTDTVSMELVTAITDLCNKDKAAYFNGFNESDPMISDGSGFALYVRFNNGKKISSSGMNSFPPGYRDFCNEMHELFKPYCDKVRAKALQKKIDQGVSGELTSMHINFFQNGTSGSDKYEVSISRADGSKKNFHVRIHSASGEFFPKGDYDYFSAVPDETINWKAFTQLVQKHQLVQWMDYFGTAKDYNNSEWFQMDFLFGKGYINAQGTEHPAHYDAFRKDFLSLLRKTIKKIKN